MVAACSSEPPVDVLLATYNGEKYISEQIESILNQTYTNWRLLISDDGSSDSTLDIINRYIKKDGRINLLSLVHIHRSGSAAGNFLALTKASTAPYAMFCDQDDVWEPHKIAVEMDAMQQLELEHGSDVPLLIFADSAVVDEHLNVLYPSFVSTFSFDPETISLSRLLASNIAQGCTMLLNRILINAINETSLPASVGIHDHWAALIAAALGAISYVPQPLVKYRQHADNVIGAEESATARKGVSRFLQNPEIIVHWLDELSANNTKFIQRAADMKERWGEDSVSADILEVLNDLSSFKERNRIGRLQLIRQYRLMPDKGRKNLYTRACQFIGMMA